MSKNLFKQSLVIVAVSMCIAPWAMAAKYPTETFDATYVVTTNGVKTDMRMASDGKGHFFTQTSANGQKYGTIVDYLNGTSTSLIPQGKMAMRTKLPPNGAYVAETDRVKEKNGKSLGSKTVNGHPCHGYEYTNSGAKTETWIGDDCKIVVQSVTHASGTDSTMDLKTIAGKPSGDLFEVPAGYKIMGQ
jgi:hypothetical protein